MTTAHNRIDRCVEALCEQGCDRVNSFIAALRAGHDIPEVAGLSMEERQRVLENLVSIMAVYGDRCESR
ncbi:MAG: hypothetical protein WBN57_02215 [Gammaproteobacteria bacterium]